MESRIKIRLPEKEKILYAATGLLLALLLFPAKFTSDIFPVDPTEPWNTLDPSWLITLSYINKENFSWGSEFAFTYGPLSYFVFRVGWGISKYSLLLFDLFIAFNLSALFYLTFRDSENKWFTACLMLTLIIALPVSFGVGVPMVLMGFLLFWINRSLVKDTHFYNIIQIAILLLLFYMKFNVGLIVFVFYFTGMAYKLIFRIQKPVIIVAYIIVLALALYGSALMLNVDLQVYTIAGSEFISGYNDAMGYEGGFIIEQLLAVLFIALPGFILLVRVFENKDTRYRIFLMMFFYGSAMFVLYKQAFIRGGLGHVLEFFKTALFLLFCTFPLQNLKPKRYTIILSSFLVVIPVFFLAQHQPSHFSIARKIDKEYIEGFANFTTSSGFRLFPNNNRLPQEILDKIGNHTVDVFPWNTHMLFENKLNYLPRPVMQAYAAYTPYLATLNFEHYNSKKAPQFVIFDLMTVDNRYALFDDAKVNIILMKNYTVVTKFDYFGRELLLLEKKPNAEPIAFKKIKEYAMYVDAPLIPREGIYYEVVPYHSLKGKVLSLLDRSPEIMLVANLANGQVIGFKTSPKLLETGIFSTRAIFNIRDFSRIIGDKNTDSIPQVEYYSLKLDDPACFGDKIRIREYKIK